MATISVDGHDAVVRLTTWEKLGAVRGDVRFPIASVRACRPVTAPFAEVRGLRAPGTALPRRIALGTWRRRGGREFVAVHRGQPGIVVELDRGQARFDRLILSVADTDEACRLLATGR